MNIILVAAICMLITGNIVLMVSVSKLTKDLRDYAAIIESTMENNNKLIQINESMMSANKNLHERLNKIDELCIKQNDLCKSVINDNIELTARLNEVLLHIDDGK